MKNQFYFFSLKTQFSIDLIRMFLHHNKPAGSWIENYSILGNNDQFLIFMELKVTVKNGRDIFQEFRFSNEKEALTEFVRRIPSITMIYIMAKTLKFNNSLLDNSPLKNKKITTRFSSIEMKRKVILHYHNIRN
jgi:hypothetical protein